MHSQVTSALRSKIPNTADTPRVQRGLRHIWIGAGLSIGAVMIGAGPADAAGTITQTFTNLQSGAFTDLVYANSSTTSPTDTRTTTATKTQAVNKFSLPNPNAALTAVRFTATGPLTGSFRGAYNSTNTPLSSLGGGTASLDLNFLTSGWTVSSGTPTSFAGAHNLARGCNPSTIGNPPQTVCTTTSGGNLVTSTNPSYSVSGNNSNTFLSFFTSTGPGDTTINALFTWTANITSNNLSPSSSTTPCTSSATSVNNGVKCTAFDFTPAGLTTGQTALVGNITSFTVEYDWQYRSVPGPLPILGAGVAFAYTRRLRRRIGKARTL